MSPDPAPRFRVPFNRMPKAGTEAAAVARALDEGHGAGDGPFTRRAHALLEEITGVRKALFTTSCTHALEMSALLLDLRPGDEVIVPAYTFVSTPNAFALHGARPVFADIRLDTLNLDETRLEGKIGPRTRAVVPVHYGGVACEMDALLEIAGRRGLTVIEDNAHGLFGRYRGKPLGSFGRMSTLSFHETKNISCGEGGALLLNDLDLVPRAEILRQKGTDRSRFLRGEVDRYTWVDLGSSYVGSDLLAAVLCCQLEARERLQARRLAIWNAYRKELAEWADRNGIRMQSVPPGCEPPAHLFCLLMPTAADRESLGRFLKDRGISAVSHYTPLHLSAMGRRYGAGPGDCPVTERVCDTLIRLPLFSDLGEPELEYVIESTRAWRR